MSVVKVQIRQIITENNIICIVFCVDGLLGFKEAIEAVHFGANIQKCVIHMLKNSFKYVNSCFFYCPVSFYNEPQKFLCSYRHKNIYNLYQNKGSHVCGDIRIHGI